MSRHWIRRNCIFRVDNSHTAMPCHSGVVYRRDSQEIPRRKSFSLRPSPVPTLYSLASWFTQSYTYFTRRNTKDELQEYFEEISKPPSLTSSIQISGPILPISSTLHPEGWPSLPSCNASSSPRRLPNYGIYGPAFELCVKIFQSGREVRILDSENTRSAAGTVPEARVWLLSHAAHQIRRNNPALQSDGSIHSILITKHNLLQQIQPEQPNSPVPSISTRPRNKQVGSTGLETTRSPA
jgi:starch synthase (maltosyl-transferring)